MPRKAWFVLGLIGVVVAFYLGTIRSGHDWTGDFALYILHARNLVEGRAYADTGYIYNPNFTFLSPPTYPPGFPMMLAPIYALCGLNLFAMKTVCVVFFGLALLAIFVALRHHLPFGGRMALLALLGFNPYFWQFKNNILADLPFLFLSYAGLGMIDNFTSDRANRSRGASCLCGVATGLVLFLACATRSVGLVFLGCLVVFYALRSRRFDLFVAAAIGTMSLGVIIENVTVHDDSRYFDQLGVYLTESYSALSQIAIVIRHWIHGLALLGDNGRAGSLAWVLAILGCTLAGAGFVARIRNRGWTIFEVFTLLYPATIVFWPMAQSFRFLIPVVPLYIGYALLGSQWLGTMIRSQRARVGIGLFLLVVVFGSYVSRYTTLEFSHMREGILNTDSRQLFRYVREQTEPEDVLIFAKPRILALMTQRYSACYSVVSDDIYLERFLASINATHLITTRWLKSDRIWLQGFLERHADQLELVFENYTHHVYRMRSGASWWAGG